MLYIGLILLGFLLGFYVKGFHVPDIAVVAGFMTGQVIHWGFTAAAMLVLAPALKKIQTYFRHWRVQHFYRNHKGFKPSRCSICV